MQFDPLSAQPCGTRVARPGGNVLAGPGSSSKEPERVTSQPPTERFDETAPKHEKLTPAVLLYSGWPALARFRTLLGSSGAVECVESNDV